MYYSIFLSRQVHPALELINRPDDREGYRVGWTTVPGPTEVKWPGLGPCGFLKIFYIYIFLISWSGGRGWGLSEIMSWLRNNQRHSIVLKLDTLVVGILLDTEYSRCKV